LSRTHINLVTDVTQATDSLTHCVERILRHQAKSMTKSYSEDFFKDVHSFLRCGAKKDEHPKKSPQYDEEPA
jgi:alcohol dehydrogenase class IV